MAAFQRALLISTGERYFVLAMNFVRIAVVSRLLTPSEIGVSVIGMAIVSIAMSVREFASASFLIQHHDLGRQDIRGAFSVMLILTLAIIGALTLAAPAFASAYREENLLPYLHVISVCLFVELFSAQIMTLLRREMAFGKTAIINLASTTTGVVATIVFALLGFSFMSFAWAWLTGAVVAGVVALSFRPHFWMFLPSFKNWRGMIEFGGYNGITVGLYRLYEQLPYLTLGQLASPNAAGLFSRGLMLCELPDKLLLGGVVQVVLPAFAAEARQGRSLKPVYLRSLSLVTAVLWPAHLSMALLAHPIVEILLGHQWLEVVPLVQIVAIASLFAFSFELNYPVLVAQGAIRDVFLRALIVFPMSAIIVVAATWAGGLYATAWSMMLVIPFHAFVSLQFVRRRISIRWRDIARAVSGSAVVAALSATGPLVVAAAAGFRLDFSVAQMFAACLLALVGWLVGMWSTQHVLLEEIARLVPPLRRIAPQH
jgi:O-antigen/teichoic acid export membrane protein